MYSLITTKNQVGQRTINHHFVIMENYINNSAEFDFSFSFYTANDDLIFNGSYNKDSQVMKIVYGAWIGNEYYSVQKSAVVPSNKLRTAFSIALGKANKVLKDAK